VGAAPVDVGEAQVEVAEHAADRDVGEAEAGGDDRVAVAQEAVGLGRARPDLAELAVDPAGALVLGRAETLEEDQDRRVTHAVGEGLDLLVGDAGGGVLGDEAGLGLQLLEVLDDDARVVDRDLVLEDQDRGLGQRVVDLRDRVRVPGHVEDGLEGDALLDEGHAGLAGERLGRAEIRRSIGGTLQGRPPGRRGREGAPRSRAAVGKGGPSGSSMRAQAHGVVEGAGRHRRRPPSPHTRGGHGQQGACRPCAGDAEPGRFRRRLDTS
jgi:hypothetical protein